MRILLSGLTAAGKTTHGELLSRHFGLPLVRMVDVMGDVLREAGQEAGSDAQLPDVWTAERDLVRQTDDSLDREADRRMLAKAQNGCGVFDAWALPWLYPGDAVRVWIASDESSRARKHTVSVLMRGQTPPQDTRRINAQKDDWTRGWFDRLYGIELAPTRGLFDVVLDNSHLIPSATVACARRGIAAFHPTLVASVERVTDGE